MTKENFTKFLNEKQRDSRLNEELFPRLRQDQIKALIDKYEPCSNNANRGETYRWLPLHTAWQWHLCLNASLCLLHLSGLISPEGLLFYLMGPETSVVVQDRLAQCQEMTHPIPHYFIKSSHNTYLTGHMHIINLCSIFLWDTTQSMCKLACNCEDHSGAWWEISLRLPVCHPAAGQFSGVSSPEMYRQCLLSGCRCLELDCWKGKPPDEEPIITHGFTMTTEILFKVVFSTFIQYLIFSFHFPTVNKRHANKH